MKAKTKELADSVGAVYPVLFMGRHDGVLFTETELETFVDLVAAAEREACAKVCSEAAIKLFGGKSRVNQIDMHTAGVLQDTAEAIRARGTT